MLYTSLLLLDSTYCIYVYVVYIKSYFANNKYFFSVMCLGLINLKSKGHNCTKGKNWLNTKGKNWLNNDQ